MMKLGMMLTAVALIVAATLLPARAEDKLKVLLIDGQNNHDWKATTPVLKWMLEDTGRFAVEVSTTPPAAARPPQAPKGDATEKQKTAYATAQAKWKLEHAAMEQTGKPQWESWHPDFKKYAVIVSNYNGDSWPLAVQKEFVDYVKGGGGLVIVHAADNSFGDWPEYNEMIGLGGWGGRNEKSGPMVRWKDGKFTRDETPGAGGTHGKQHEFIVEARDTEHPIMKGLPTKWKHTADELYSKLRGPAKDMQILATAYHAADQNGTSENEPILMVISYGKGRVFHTTLGHGVVSMSSLGFQVTLDRGTEWAATGKVTLPAPTAEALTADKAAVRPPPESALPAKK